MENAIKNQEYLLSTLKNYSSMLRKLDGFDFYPIVNMNTNKTESWQVRSSFAVSVHGLFLETMPASLQCEYSAWMIRTLSESKSNFLLTISSKLLKNDKFKKYLSNELYSDNVTFFFENEDLSESDLIELSDNLRNLKHMGWKCGLEYNPTFKNSVILGPTGFFDYIRIDLSIDRFAFFGIDIPEILKLNPKKVIVNNVTTICDANSLRTMGLVIGQGTIWPMVHRSVSVPYEVCLKAAAI